tara:strand:- start:18 stop:437 length:420 start_codon:yes stop_codon:yes gene_type:complete
MSVRANGMNTDTEHVVWNKSPIQMSLPVGKERMITFPSQVSVQLADSENNLTTEDIKLLNNDDTLYITANRSFPKTRLYVKTVTGIDNKTGNIQYGETMLLDITPSVSNTDDTPMVVVNAQQTALNANQEKEESINNFV